MGSGSGSVVPPSHSGSNLDANPQTDNSFDPVQAVLTVIAGATHVVAAKFAILTAVIFRNGVSANRHAKAQEKRDLERAAKLEEYEKKKQELLTQANVNSAAIGKGLTDATTAFQDGVTKTIASVDALGVRVGETSVSVNAVEAAVKQLTGVLSHVAVSADRVAAAAEQTAKETRGIRQLCVGAAVAVLLAFVIAATVWVDRQSLALRAMPASVAPPSLTLPPATPMLPAPAR
jgi:hypothetical protein